MILSVFLVHFALAHGASWARRDDKWDIAQHCGAEWMQRDFASEIAAFAGAPRYVAHDAAVRVPFA
jgi:hypothetical protein